MSEQHRFYQVVSAAFGTYSAPYQTRERAVERAQELAETHPEHSFSAERWPNHRQSDETAVREVEA